MIFALVGNQNCGKTTLFNALTGSNQHVGNFPGVTVDQKMGEIIDEKGCSVVDLPGIYSLRPYTQEEIVSRAQAAGYWQIPAGFSAFYSARRRTPRQRRLLPVRRSGQSYPRPRSKSEGCRPEDPCSVNPLCCPPSKGCSGSGFKTLKPVCRACLLCSNAPLYSA